MMTMGQRLNLPSLPDLPSFHPWSFVPPLWSLCSLTHFLGVVPFGGDTEWRVAIIGPSRQGLYLLLDIPTIHPRKVPWTHWAHNKWWLSTWGIRNDLQFNQALYWTESCKSGIVAMGPLSQVHSHQLEKDPFFSHRTLELVWDFWGISSGCQCSMGLDRPFVLSSPCSRPISQEHQHKPLSDKGLLAHCTKGPHRRTCAALSHQTKRSSYQVGGGGMQWNVNEAVFC